MGKRLGKRGSAALKLLLAVVVGLYFSLAGFRTTPVGTQCPTAPVQAIRVAQVGPCGCKTFKIRAPQPGEKGFVQCACAEKKEAKAVSSTVKETLGSLSNTVAFASSNRFSDLLPAPFPVQNWAQANLEVPVKPPTA